VVLRQAQVRCSRLRLGASFQFRCSEAGDATVAEKVAGGQARTETLQATVAEEEIRQVLHENL